MDQLLLLGKRELVFLLLFTCSFVVSVSWRFLFFLVLGMGCAFLLWHSLGLPLIIFLPVGSHRAYESNASKSVEYSVIQWHKHIKASHLHSLELAKSHLWIIQQPLGGNCGAPSELSNKVESNSYTSNESNYILANNPTCFSSSDTSSYSTELTLEPKGLHFCNLNIQHILSKIDELRIIMTLNNCPEIL